MADRIDAIIDGVIAAESGYVNNPSDKGGETCWGITVAVARANGYPGAMRLLPRATAAAIYRKRYVDEPGFAQILPLALLVAAELVDTGVNMGPMTAIGFLQRSLNALNRQAKDYPDVALTGKIDAPTLGALKAFIAKRAGQAGERVLVLALNCLQGARYIELGEKRPANEDFMFGWLGQRVTL